MKKVLVLRGPSKYNVLVEAATQVASGFAARGYEVKLVDIVKLRDYEFAREMTDPSYSFLFSCQALGFGSTLSNGQPMTSVLPRPYIGWIFDDIIYHSSRVKRACYDNTWLLTIDKECGRAIQKMYPEVRHVNCLHHGGFCATITGEKEAEEPFWRENQKDIAVLFPANLRDEPAFTYYVEHAPKVVSYLARETVELLEERPYLAIRKALELVLERSGEELTGELLCEMADLIHIIDLYIRWKSRYEILVALLKAGIHVTVVGEGATYQRLAEEYREQLHFTGGADIQDVVKLMARSRVIVNPCPVLTEGMHERLCTAMLCKAVCFTPWTPYLETHFGNCFQYINLDNLDEMTGEIQYILAHPEEAEELIEKNYAYAMEYHTWKRRGEEIVDFYENQIAPGQRKESL